MGSCSESTLHNASTLVKVSCTVSFVVGKRKENTGYDDNDGDSYSSDTFGDGAGVAEDGDDGDYSADDGSGTGPWDNGPAQSPGSFQSTNRGMLDEAGQCLVLIYRTCEAEV